MNIETVNELIASLESAGELSIKERKYLELAKAYVQLAAENVGLKESVEHAAGCISAAEAEGLIDALEETTDERLADLVHRRLCHAYLEVETPATDRIYAGIKANCRIEGAHFVANRMLAAWDAGFIEDTAKNAADIARMILTSTEFMADAPEGDFDRSFADGILEDIAQQLREEAK